VLSKMYNRAAPPRRRTNLRAGNGVVSALLK
jgi:hypothetical protein